MIGKNGRLFSMLKSTSQLVLHSYPGLIALVTAKHDAQANMMAAGWHSYMSVAPPIYGVAIGKERFTYELIQKSGSFAINFVSAEYAHYIEVSGKTSGRDGDKLEKMMAKWQAGEATGAPILENAYVAYECTIRDCKAYGDHDWMSGDIKLFYKNDDLFEENGLPNFTKLQIPLFLGQSHYLIADNGTTMKHIQLEPENTKSE
jgi:flavin reductase (DIM6/NTAB) family NADH-FMN oxidoreductase RutF